MRQFLFICCMAICSPLFGASQIIEDESQLTEDFFASEWIWDHTKPFKEFFKYKKIGTFLEFGLGLGTKFYIDHCDKVVSVELVVESTKTGCLPWYERTVKLFQHHRNWKPFLYTCSPLFDYYNIQAKARKITHRKFKAYIQEVDSIIEWAFQKGQPDLVFIDQGTYPRAYFVNRLFGKVNIIAAHDTNFPNWNSENWYGYNWINDDPRYEKIKYTKGCGTTFWIKKEEKGLIEHLKKAFSAAQ